MKTPRRGHEKRGRLLIPRPSTPASAIELAIARGEWERMSLLLLIAMTEAVRQAPAGTIDDVLALLSDEEAPS